MPGEWRHLVVTNTPSRSSSSLPSYWVNIRSNKDVYCNMTRSCVLHKGRVWAQLWVTFGTEREQLYQECNGLFDTRRWSFPPANIFSESVSLNSRGGTSLLVRASIITAVGLCLLEVLWETLGQMSTIPTFICIVKHWTCIRIVKPSLQHILPP